MNGRVDIAVKQFNAVATPHSLLYLLTKPLLITATSVWINTGKLTRRCKYSRGGRMVGKVRDKAPGKGWRWLLRRADGDVCGVCVVDDDDLSCVLMFVAASYWHCWAHDLERVRRNLQLCGYFEMILCFLCVHTFANGLQSLVPCEFPQIVW